jgi:hypothetical protein
MNKVTIATALTLMLAGLRQRSAACSTGRARRADSGRCTRRRKPAADQPAQPPPPVSADQMIGQKLDQVLAGDWRSDKNKARDKYRHPKQVLEFFGVSPARR